VQLRYRAPALPARVVEAGPDALALALDEPAWAVAPGQSGVLYDGDRVLGGGLVA
jgi:tRNA-specific 2-thiouridylase